MSEDSPFQSPFGHHSPPPSPVKTRRHLRQTRMPAPAPALAQAQAQPQPQAHHVPRRSKEREHQKNNRELYSSYRKPKILQYATLKLLEGMAPQLIKYIYDHPDHEAFRDPEIRVGICIKLLYNLERQYDEDILRPILKDIQYLMDSKAHLEATDDPQTRLECLDEELHLVQRYIDLDDTISLNTEIQLPTHGRAQTQTKGTHPNSQNVYGNQPEEGCVIM